MRRSDEKTDFVSKKRRVVRKESEKHNGEMEKISKQIENNHLLILDKVPRTVLPLYNSNAFQKILLGGILSFQYLEHDFGETATGNMKILEIAGERRIKKSREA